MTQQRSPNELVIIEPCDVAWEDMKGDERQRYCDDCQLNVHNFIEFTDEEINRTLDQPGRVCAQIFQDSDGEVLTKSVLQKKRQQRRWYQISLLSIFACVSTTPVAFGIVRQMDWQSWFEPSEESPALIRAGAVTQQPNPAQQGGKRFVGKLEMRPRRSGG